MSAEVIERVRETIREQGMATQHRLSLNDTYQTRSERFPMSTYTWEALNADYAALCQEHGIVYRPLVEGGE